MPIRKPGLTMGANTIPLLDDKAYLRPRDRVLFFSRRVFGGDPLVFTGVLLLAALIIIALLGSVLVSHDPRGTTSDTLQSPSREHWFGTDEYGRDVYSRVVSSLQLDFLVAITGVTGAVILGVIIGAISGFIGGRFDDIAMRLVDVVQSFPMLIMAMILVTILGVGVRTVIIVTVLINVPVYARLIRGETLGKKRLEYIDAARCSGCTEPRILFRHLLPNIASPLIVQASLNTAWALTNVAALSFLGIGINPPTPDLGLMVSEGSGYISHGIWWLSVFPGFVLALAVFGFNLVGDGLQDRLDPRRKWR